MIVFSNEKHKNNHLQDKKKITQELSVVPCKQLLLLTRGEGNSCIEGDQHCTALRRRKQTVGKLGAGKMPYPNRTLTNYQCPLLALSDIWIHQQSQKGRNIFVHVDELLEKS